MTEQPSTTAILVTPIERSHPMDVAIAGLRRLLDGQMLASQDRCVDGLLDLFNAAEGNDTIRAMVTDILDDIRHLSAVRASEMEGRLHEVEAALAVEAAFTR